MAALAHTNPGSSGSSCRSDREGTGLGSAFPGVAQIEALSQHRAQGPEALFEARRKRPRHRDHDIARTVRIPPDPFHLQEPGVGTAQRRRCQPARAIGITPGGRQHPQPSGRQLHDDRRRRGFAGLEDGGRPLALQQRWHRRRIHQPSHDRIVAVDLPADVVAGDRAAHPAERTLCLGPVGRRVQGFEDPRCLGEITDGAAPRPGRSRQPAQLQVAEGDLVPFPQQFEDADALAEVVVRLRCPAAGGVQPAAQPQEFPPRAAHRARLNPRSDGIELGQCLRRFSQRQEGFDRDQVRHQGVGRGRVRGAGELAADRDRPLGIAAPQRDAGVEHPHRPLIPAAGLGLPVGGAGPLQALGRFFVGAAYDVDLSQRVEDRAGGLPPELHRAPHVERAVQRFLGPLQLAQPHADLPERRQRHPQAVRCARLLLQLHASLRQGERLLVPVLDQRHVCLVAAHRREDVPGLHHQRQPLGMPQRGHRLVESPFLRVGDAREGMDHREMAAVPGGVQRGGGLGDVLADDSGVADLPVAEPQLVVREADGAGVVGPLGQVQGAGEKSNPAGGLVAGHRDPAVEPPQVRQPRRIQPLTGFRLAAERLGCVPEVVL